MLARASVVIILRHRSGFIALPRLPQDSPASFDTQKRCVGVSVFMIIRHCSGFVVLARHLQYYGLL